MHEFPIGHNMAGSMYNVFIVATEYVAVDVLDIIVAVEVSIVDVEEAEDVADDVLDVAVVVVVVDVDVSVYFAFVAFVWCALFMTRWGNSSSSFGRLRVKPNLIGAAARALDGGSMTCSFGADERRNFAFRHCGDEAADSLPDVLLALAEELGEDVRCHQIGRDVSGVEPATSNLVGQHRK